MGKFVFVSLAVLMLMVCVVSAIDHECPPSSKMISCSPTCKDDSTCFGKKCCPNICNTKSCVPANLNTQNEGYKNSNQKSGTGSYCGNVKCNSFEKCELDRSTKRQKCVRQ